MVSSGGKRTFLRGWLEDIITRCTVLDGSQFPNQRGFGSAKCSCEATTVLG